MPPVHRAENETRRDFLRCLAGAGAAFCWAPDIEAAPTEAADRLIYHSRQPANAEPPLARLVDHWLTPNELFYIRSHAPVPELDVSTYRLSVEGLVDQPLRLTVEQLHELADADAIATLTCAGNRRSEHSRVRQVDGVPWNEGAIGNARWSGVKLSTLLRRAGLKEGARHVWFEGLDEIKKGESTIAFGGSIPLEKALLDTQNMPGAIIATKMNGKALPPDHGFPVRSVVPGYIGARSVKWLGRIVVSDRSSPNHYLQNAYKIVPDADKLALAEAGPIYRYPTNSAICSPVAGATLKPGKMTVAGYALADGTPGSTIARVNVSTNGGRTWTAARVEGAARPFCWQLWQAEVQVEPSTNLLICRAVDSMGQSQPRAVLWNMKGYLYNAWHRVPVKVEG